MNLLRNILTWTLAISIFLVCLPFMLMNRLLGLDEDEEED
jgi:hypothetical protein